MDDVKQRKIIEQLQMGSEMTVYQKRTERITVQVIMETMQVALTRSGDRIVKVVDISELKEVRQWETFKDFQRFNENRGSAFRRIFCQSEKDVQQDRKTCFTIFYGSDFTLKSLSLNAHSVEDAEKWLTGLELLKQETLAAHTPVIIKSWLRKQMYSVDLTKKNSITLKELKSLLPQMNFNVPSGRFLEDRFKEVEANDYVLDFLQFHKLYEILIFENQTLRLHYKSFICHAFLCSNIDRPDSSVVALYDFQNFLLYQQKEAWATDLIKVQNLMTIFIDDPTRRTKDPAFTIGEFLSFLFSKENQICDDKFSEICPLDMNNPLSHYWINSSHNTYLTGDQLRSESSTEAYVRCLRLGCRCIELDCWNGPDEPVIFHGRTMTSKIKFKDVVKAINNHAFATSQYPVVLSIEEHCDIKQQKMMAQTLRDVFQDKLLTEPLDPEAEHLPSPNQLKGKIIIKHQKIKENDHTIKPEEEEENTAVKIKLDNFRKIANTYREKIRKSKEISLVEKEGELSIWDPIDKRFYKHDCVISDNKLYYSEEKWEEQSTQIKDSSELHLSEPWFHGRLAEGRITAEKLLRDYCKGTDGNDETFLVRESNTFIGNYCISLWTRGRIQHYRIFCFPENGHKIFFLKSKECFPSMCALIDYYRQQSIDYDRFNLCLKNFLPRLNFEPLHHMGWFYSNMSRAEAEDCLLRIPRDGAFLIRKRNERDTFALSIRSEGDIKHYKIFRKSSKYVLADAYEFFSLEDMVSCFRNQQFAGKTKLRYPVTPQLVERFCMEDLSTYDSEQDSEVIEDNPLGDQCKGVVDILKCNAARKAKHGRPLVVTLLNKENQKLTEFTCEIVEQLDEWYLVILNIIQREQSLEKSRKAEVESKTKIAIEMSNMVVYCQSIKKKTFENYNYKEVRSLPDNIIPKEGNESGMEKSDCILEYNRTALTRVYPSGARVDSSNFDPCPAWKLGCQMVALNFQTDDNFMQLNSALFSLNGGAGYVLKPEWMRDPTRRKPAKQSIRIRVLAARHLPNPDHIVSPFVQVELWPNSGQAEDYTFKTTLFKDNGLNPVWLGPMNPPKSFEVNEPDLAFLRFVVFEEDMFSDAKFLAQATFPFRCICSGYRSVPLKNRFSENLELASLLVHVQQYEV
nr:1-phosphatidylinositol 4,5-bisphosphate phosphodiesterase gamma-2 [Danio rerio]|eukprot:XP_021323447.1 1-phosphatidylinositol 4,5-bisphosphate phosphodiesterase gamma-2 [Danio rerio]